MGFGQSVGVATVGVAKRPYVTFLRLIARSPVAVGVADRMYVKFRRSIVTSLMGRKSGSLVFVVACELSLSTTN